MSRYKEQTFLSEEAVSLTSLVKLPDYSVTMLGSILFFLLCVHASLQQEDPQAPDVFQVVFVTDISATPVIIKVCRLPHFIRTSM